MKKNLSIGIICSSFNREVVECLLDRCRATLVENGVPAKNIAVTWVPGAYELPFMAKIWAASKKFDALICLGCIIKGETSHDQHIATWASVGIGQVSLESNLPVMFGVLTPNSEDQAWERAKAGPLDRGHEVAQAALRMIDLSREKL